jgi:hypothetical protein
MRRTAMKESQGARTIATAPLRTPCDFANFPRNVGPYGRLIPNRLTCDLGINLYNFYLMFSPSVCGDAIVLFDCNLYVQCLFVFIYSACLYIQYLFVCSVLVCIYIQCLFVCTLLVQVCSVLVCMIRACVYVHCLFVCTVLVECEIALWRVR